MIGGLQGDFRDLDIKYLKQNISKCRSQISGSFRRTPRHCAKWLRNSPGKRYQRIRICLTRKVETPSFPIRRQAPDVKYPKKVERWADRILDVRYPEKVECWQDRILSLVEWAMPRVAKGDRLRVQGVGTPLPDDTERASLSGFPKREAHDTREHHTPDDSIPYPDMLSGSLTKVCHNPHSAALQWCVWTLCPDIFAIDSKELSLISDCFGDKKAIKTPKLNTIWLELIARVLNMLSRLKDDNYYSKVFKRVNYKLSNSTFWVVIILHH